MDHKGDQMAQEKKSTKSEAKSKKAEKTVSPEVDIDKTTTESTNIDQANTNKTAEQSGSVAKAGKRSAKALKEAEEKQSKEERKTIKEDDVVKTKATQNPTRTRLERRSKSYREKQQNIDTKKQYSIDEAAELVIKTNPVKFDATVELHMRLAVDPRQADQNIRDSVLLPAGSGKTIRVAAYVDGDDITAAKEAGAELVGEADVTKELEAGSFSFDILIATPSQMPKLGKYARLLGPRGLMPNPKSGTVTNDVAKAITEAKAGKVEYRVDSGGNIHVGIGKVSFKPAQIQENLQAILSSIQNNKPASIKGAYIISAYLSTSMGPSIKLTV